MYEQSASWMPQDPLLTQYGRWTIQQRGISASQVPGCTSYCQNTTGTVGWENSRLLTTPPLVSSRNEPRNSKLMTCHYPDQGSAFDWLMQISYVARPIRSATQILVLTRHQYGISALVSKMSFRGEAIFEGFRSFLYKVFRHILQHNISANQVSVWKRVLVST